MARRAAAGALHQERHQQQPEPPNKPAATQDCRPRLAVDIAPKPTPLMPVANSLGRRPVCHFNWLSCTTAGAITAIPPMADHRGYNVGSKRPKRATSNSPCRTSGDLLNGLFLSGVPASDKPRDVHCCLLTGRNALVCVGCGREVTASMSATSRPQAKRPRRAGCEARRRPSGHCRQPPLAKSSKDRCSAFRARFAGVCFALTTVQT